MRESAQAAISYLRAHAADFGLAPDFLERTDLHLHFPAGAMPKDGPSAGVTILTALVSLLTGLRVRGDVAMTGEITLRGVVLPVGGIKEKVLAAHRAGIKRVILPERCAKDLAEVPHAVKEELDFVLASRVDQVLAAAFEESPLRRAQPELPVPVPAMVATPPALPAAPA
jgi:ATP-dependent Lon protease